MNYLKSKECVNNETLIVCKACGKCGRRFNKCGRITFNPDYNEEEE